MSEHHCVLYILHTGARVTTFGNRDVTMILGKLMVLRAEALELSLGGPVSHISYKIIMILMFWKSAVSLYQLEMNSFLQNRAGASDAVNRRQPCSSVPSHFSISELTTHSESRTCQKVTYLNQ